MKKYKMTGMDLDVYKEVLDNGLNVYLIPVPNRSKNFACIGVKYGANNFEFLLDNEVKKVPSGIAHFLEHKLFAQEKGPEPFEFFGRSGASSNASTGYKKTIYYFSGTSSFGDNLEYLINFVNSPYFTDENVANEKDIIVQEVNMLNDDPEWKIEEEFNNMLFNHSNYRYPIGGTEEDVRSITKEDLYFVYDYFYNPNNMTLIVSGNIDVNESIALIKNNIILNSRKKKNTPVFLNLETNDVVLKRKEIVIDNNVNDKLFYGWKIDLDKFNIPYIKLDVYLSIILGILYGNTSEFRNDLLMNNTFISFSYNVKYDEKYAIIEFNSETNNFDKVVDEINKYFTKHKITEEELNRYKKVVIANSVFNSEDEVFVAKNIFEDIIEFGEIDFGILDFVRKISLTDLEEVKKNIDINNSSILIVKSKEK